jgi:hypothetical protein
MDAFSPEFSRFWQPAAAARNDVPQARSEDDSRAQQAALEELADRVSAARSIV